MKHAIVGFGDVGAKVLANVNGSLTDTLIAHSKGVALEYFYVFPFFDQTLADTVTFVPPQNVYQYSQDALQKAGSVVEGDIKNIFKNYPVDVEKAGQLIKEANADINRRMYTVMFHMEAKAFLQRLFGSIDQQGDVYFIIDARDIPGSAILMRILQLMRKAFQKPISAYITIFFDESNIDPLTPAQKACIYAFLVEMNHRRSENTHIRLVGMKDANEYQLKQVAISHQIAEAIASVSLAWGVDESLYQDGNKLLDMADITVELNSQLVQKSAAQLFAQIIYRAFFFTDYNPDFIRPEWMEKLFIEKQWFLHDDYLSMDLPIGNVKQDASWSTIEREWDSRSDFFMGKLNEEDDWDIQYQDFDRYMMGAYSKMFRGQGVDLFYAVNESGLQSSAKLITDQIEEQLVLEYKNLKHTLAEIFVIVDEIIAKVDLRLQQANHLFEHENQESKNNRIQYDNIYNDYMEGSKGDKKRIVKNYPISEMANFLKNHYVAECHVKSLSFAKKLLKQVIANLTDLKGFIEKKIGESDERLQQLMSNVNRFTANNIINAPQHKHWQVAQVHNFFDRLPQNLKMDALAEHGQIANNFFRTQFQTMRFEKLFANMMEEDFYNDIVEYVSKSNDFCTGKYKDPDLERELFKNSIMAFVDQKSPIFLEGVKSIVEDRNPYQDKDAAPRSTFWFFPPNIFTDDELNQVAGTLIESAPESQPVKNVDMLVEHLVMRGMSSFPLKNVPKLKEIQEEYTKFILDKNGFLNTLTLHPDLTDPFTPYENEFIEKEKPDAIRKALLTGELGGNVVCKDDGVFVAYQIGSEGVMFHVGKDFQDILQNATPAALRFIRHAMDSHGEVQLKPEMAEVLSKRLQEIQKVCLNGKTDIKKATWQEAGAYMPWSRVGESLLDQIKKL